MLEIFLADFASDMQIDRMSCCKFVQLLAVIDRGPIRTPWQVNMNVGIHFMLERRSTQNDMTVPFVRNQSPDK
ncbi:hypothetical protein WM00_02055 [Burkholderia cepacia]|nr:hypothetical protein WL58_24955 [Burkholderia cepacia]KWH54012.1 hypothetical protein WM00_02055 [Burkholderia cepacia]